MKKSFIRTLVFAFVCFFGLVGCSSNEGSSTVPSTTNTTNTANADVSAVYNPQQITQELCENLSIDAKAVIPDKTQYSTYTLKMVDSTPDRLFNIFSQDGPESYTSEERGDPGSSITMYVKSDGQNIVVYNNAISYSAYKDDNTMQTVADLMYYYTQEYSQSQPHDLSFMTVTQMEEYGRDILSALGIAWEPELSKCVTLSGQEILDFQKEMLQKSSYAEFETPTTLTTAEDTCYLEFTFTYDGIPLLGSDEPEIYSNIDMLPPPACTAVMIFNANGIQDCDVNFPCTAEPSSDPQTILSAEEAIAALKAKYDLEILYDAQKIVGIWLEYIPMNQGQSTVLTPYWCFSISSLIEKSDGTDYWTEPEYAERINAITGKDLAYGE